MIEMEEYISIKDIREVYNEEMLIACQNGIPCSYGICDECPNTLEKVRSNEND